MAIEESKWTTTIFSFSAPERLAVVLHDMFAVQFDEIATMLGAATVPLGVCRPALASHASKYVNWESII
jgi:hypothetical protein